MNRLTGSCQKVLKLPGRNMDKIVSLSSSSKKHGSRLDRKLTFDFAGRRIVENFEAKNTVFDEHEFLQSLKVTN